MKTKNEPKDDSSIEIFLFTYKEESKIISNVEDKAGSIKELLEKRETGLQDFMDKVKTQDMPKLRQKVINGEISLDEYLS